jgi:hypothetical protein
MVVLIDGCDGGLVALKPALRDRVRARLTAARCDQRLAMGEPPERDVCLALRAQRLVRSDTRHWLARSLHRLLEEARRPARPGPVPTMSLESRRRLVESSAVVAEVIDDLERPAPLSSRGVAALCVLLRDGSGPLYGRGSARDLRDRLGQVQRELLPPTIW